MSASTWGNPNATKRVLLLHGLTGSSDCWYSVAIDFASRGYFVIAPDLLGHGSARRGSDYSIAALADELRPFLIGDDDRPYDFVVGHSLGGLVTLALFPLLKSTRSVGVILVDPPLERTPEQIICHKTQMGSWLENVTSPEVFQANLPRATREDAIFGCLGPRLCDRAVLDAIFDQNTPWSFSHLLLTIPDNIKVTVLAADPSKDACVKEEDLRGYPNVTLKTVWGACHVIPVDDPLAIVETALVSL